MASLSVNIVIANAESGWLFGSNLVHVCPGNDASVAYFPSANNKV